TTEKIQVYATRLFDLFGGEATQNRFTADLQAHADAGSDADLQGAAQFLTEQSDFDLETGNIDLYLEEHDDITLDQPTIDKSKQVQRVYRLTSDMDAAVALIDAGLDSAVKIARMDEDVFVAEYEEVLGGLSEARDIHRTAAHYTSEVIFTLIKFNQNLNEVGGVSAIPGPVDFTVIDPAHGFDAGLEPDEGTGGVRFPNWALLFGSLNKCACQHCQTILSPGAYMVDLLEFVEGAPKKALFDRRPDL